MANKATRKELDEALNLDGKEIEVAGVTIIIKPFRLRQLSRIMECVAELSAKGLIEQPGGKRDFNPVRMLLTGGDSVLEILQIASGKDRKWIDELDALDGTKLAKTVVDVNADFFTRSQSEFQAVLGQLWPLVEEKLKTFGFVPSSSSSAAATE